MLTQNDPMMTETIDEAEVRTAEAEIRQLLSTYERSLNTADAELAASCYGPGGVFMPFRAPTIKADALQPTYAEIFKTIRLKVQFTVEELVVATRRVAYALTQSHGTQTVLASGVTTPEANREVFIFENQTGAWRIGRYMFNKSE
jgi:uncharacterized protein (TIGR02246 family)